MAGAFWCRISVRDTVIRYVFDLGYGYGRHCKSAAEQGAIRVLGLDLSQKRLEKTKKRATEFRGQNTYVKSIKPVAGKDQCIWKAEESGLLILRKNWG